MATCAKCGRTCDGATGYTEKGPDARYRFVPLCHSDFHPSCYVAWVLENAVDLDEYLKAYG